MKRLLIVLLASISITSWAQDRNLYEKRVYVDGSDSLLYRIAYPKDFNPQEEYPVILFMHGAGERASDNERQLILGGDLFVAEQVREEYPAIVIFPQCPTNEMWTHRTKSQREGRSEWIFSFPTHCKPPLSAALVNQLMDEIIAKPYTADNQIYIMGISMGGIGTLEFLYRWGDKYAAAVVICGGHDASLAQAYKEIPIWFFHGEVDDVVPHKYSHEVFEVVKRGNKRTKYKLYPKTNHNSWDQALSEPKLLKWLFNNKK